MSYQNGPRIVTNGLVLCLDAGNSKSYPGTGTTWTDLSGQGNNGTLTNGPTFNAANKGSIVFDGTNDYIDYAANSNFNLGNNFSLACWVNPSAVGSTAGHELFSLATGSGTPFISYGLEWMDTSKFRISIGNTSNQFLNYTSTGTYSLNNWYYIVGTYNGTTINLYINNILQNTTNVTTTIKYLANILAIGTWYYQGANYLNGKIASVSIYSRALSASEVAQNYNSTKGRYNL